MKKGYTVRSDFADEFITKDIHSKTYEHVEKVNDYIQMNTIHVLSDENELGKAKGDYVSIESQSINDRIAREYMIEALYESLIDMQMKMNLEPHKILVVGLGNRFITSDALGPRVASNVLVTSHLYRLQSTKKWKGTKNVAVLQPGVMGQTGLETFTIIKSVAEAFEPDLIVAIDALATRNIARINRVVQINNTGIQPGSGVGNHRHALSYETLKVPLIAIGVATVTSIGAILTEALENSGIDSKELFKHFQETTRLELVVTPKSMDDELKHLVYVVSQGLNRFLHPDFVNL